MADPHPSPAGPDRSAAKSDLRRRLLEARAARPAGQHDADATAIAGHALAWSPLAALGPGDTVAAYASVGGEPGTARLIAALQGRGVRVLLPVVAPDRVLDWAEHPGSAGAALARVRGLLEPPGPRLGPDALQGAAVVLAPALAVSPTGHRLGYGGGYYDRALARVASDTPVAVLLHADEVGLDVPTEPHDRPVTHVVSPDGVAQLTRISG